MKDKIKQPNQRKTQTLTRWIKTHRLFMVWLVVSVLPTKMYLTAYVKLIAYAVLTALQVEILTASC